MKLDRKVDFQTEELEQLRAQLEIEVSKRHELEVKVLKIEDSLFNFYRCAPVPIVIVNLEQYSILNANYQAGEHIGVFEANDRLHSTEVFSFLKPTDSHRLVEYLEQNDQLSEVTLEVQHPQHGPYQASFAFSKVVFAGASCAVVCWNRIAGASD